MDSRFKGGVCSSVLERREPVCAGWNPARHPYQHADIFCRFPFLEDRKMRRCILAVMLVVLVGGAGMALAQDEEATIFFGDVLHYRPQNKENVITHPEFQSTLLDLPESVTVPLCADQIRYFTRGATVYKVVVTSEKRIPYSIGGMVWNDAEQRYEDRKISDLSDWMDKAGHLINELFDEIRRLDHKTEWLKTRLERLEEPR